jgi:hypothetical protein
MVKNSGLLSKFVLVILFICVLILPFQLSCASLEERIEDIGSRTVQIVFVQTGGEETTGITSIGTGFILNNDGYVITSSDVIIKGQQYIEDTQTGKVAAVIRSPSWVSSGTYDYVATNDFEVVAIYSEHNLALLKLKMVEMVSPGFGNRISSVHYHNHVSGTLDVGTASFNSNVSDGTSVAVMGFASDEFVTEILLGEIMSEETSGIYNTNITAGSELNGSPAYSTDTGKIIGMCICNGSEDIVIVPASCIKNLLNSN